MFIFVSVVCLFVVNKIITFFIIIAFALPLFAVGMLAQNETMHIKLDDSAIIP